MEKETVRVNITISKELNEWYREQAGDMGIAISGLMCVALAQYREQKQALGIMENMPALFERLQGMLPQGQGNLGGEIHE